MQRIKKVELTLSALFNEFIKSRRTQQGLNSLDYAILCNTLAKIENAFEGVRFNILLEIIEVLAIYHLFINFYSYGED